MQFTAPVNGVTTSGSSYPRSELREMTNSGRDQMSFSSTVGTHKFQVLLAFATLPKVKPHVVGVQVHGGSFDAPAFRLEGTKLWITNGDNPHHYLVTDNYKANCLNSTPCDVRVLDVGVSPGQQDAAAVRRAARNAGDVVTDSHRERTASMVRLLAVVVAVVIGSLGVGVAHADEPDYEVAGTWVLEMVSGQPSIRPAPQDDTLNVTCRDDDRMKEHRFSDKALVADSYERVDGTGIMVLPRMSKPGQRLTITITCSG